MSHEIHDGVLYGRDADICEMVRQRIPNAFEGFGPSAKGLGVVRKGRLLGGVVFDNYTGRDVIMSAAFDHPSWATKTVMRRLFSYPFIQLGCRRMTTLTPRSNLAAQAADLKMGFVLEGVVRKCFPDDDDGFLFGMLVEDCKWIR